MSSELVAVIVGGALGILGTFVATLLAVIIGDRKNRKYIKTIAAGEIVAIQEKAERYLEGQSGVKELAASTPMLTSIASQLGYLSPVEAVAYRRAVTLDMELRQSPDADRAQCTVEVCERAKRVLRVDV